MFKRAIAAWATFALICVVGGIIGFVASGLHAALVIVAVGLTLVVVQVLLAALKFNEDF